VLSASGLDSGVHGISTGRSCLRPGTSWRILDPLRDGDVDYGGATSGLVDMGHGKPAGKPVFVFDCPFDSLNWEARQRHVSLPPTLSHLLSEPDITRFSSTVRTG
jgi:hypothetical protein